MNWEQNLKMRIKTLVSQTFYNFREKKLTIHPSKWSGTIGIWSDHIEEKRNIPFFLYDIHNRNEKNTNDQSFLTKQK